MSIDFFTTELKNFLRNGNLAKTHPAKLLVLGDFLEKVFNVKITELIPGIEKKIGSKVFGVKGSIDLLFSYVIFELKTDFPNEISDAELQLKKYFQSMYELHPKQKFTGIASDLIDFIIYVPVIKNNQVSGVKEIDRIKLADLEPQDAFLWMDKFFFSKHKKIRPTSEDLNFRFGPGSLNHNMVKTELENLWAIISSRSEADLKFRLWQKNMNIVYGDFPTLQGFIDQTYLVTLVKILVFLKLSDAKKIDTSSLLDALTGKYFVSYGISNLIEEDYFSWIINPKIRSTALVTVELIAKELLKYDFNAIDEDLFKEIYQNIVNKEVRHGLGEHYTPEWLAEHTLINAIQTWKKKNKGLPKILDPGCGSGTFLTNAISWYKDELKRKKNSPKKMLAAILENVAGLDLNPLAVIISRSNYLISLGNLLKAGTRITIPIYVSDSVKIPIVKRTFSGATNVYEVEAEHTRLQIPSRTFSDYQLLRQVLNGLTLAVKSYRERKNVKESESILKNETKKILNQDETDVLIITLHSIIELSDRNLNSIWMFYLNNIYAPVWFKETKFDIIAGNPPWIAMRTIQNSKYQDFLKKQVMDYGLLASGKESTKYFTHMEMATLFFCRTSDLYLKKNGIIANLMPISVITGAGHHENFREFLKPKMKLLAILDFTKIRNIFSLPVCNIIAEKEASTSFPVTIFRYSSDQNFEHNAKLEEIKNYLKKESGKYYSPKTPPKNLWSKYFPSAKEGASLGPRNMWFIDFDLHPTLPFDSKKPTVKTAEEIKKFAKDEYRDIDLKGGLEVEYIQATMEGRDLLPFGRVKFRPIFLPIEKLTTSFDVLDVDGLSNAGKSLAANWLSNNQKLWETRRKPKSAIQFPRIINRINYQNDLHDQDPSTPFIVVWNARGANAFAHVTYRKKPVKFLVDKISITAKNIIFDTTCIFIGFDDEDEAHYLCAILNSRLINKKVKPFQPRGNYGYRDIYRRPLQLSIPVFNNKKPEHQKLCKISKKCHDLFHNHNFKTNSFKAMRNEALRFLSSEYDEIDKLVKKIL